MKDIKNAAEREKGERVGGREKGRDREKEN